MDISEAYRKTTDYIKEHANNAAIKTAGACGLLEAMAYANIAYAQSENIGNLKKADNLEGFFIGAGMGLIIMSASILKKRPQKYYCMALGAAMMLYELQGA